jgi:hypothetical protein
MKAYSIKKIINKKVTTTQRAAGYRKKSAIRRFYMGTWHFKDYF